MTSHHLGDKDRGALNIKRSFELPQDSCFLEGLYLKEASAFGSDVNVKSYDFIPHRTSDVETDTIDSSMSILTLLDKDELSPKLSDCTKRKDEGREGDSR